MDTNYHDYHNHPVNQIIHFFCIPLIMITSMTFLSKIKVRFAGYYIYDIITTIMLANYLINYGFSKFIIMIVYFGICDYYAFRWQQRRFWLIENLTVFTFAWIMQFIGHYIEGNRPALMDSITSAVSQAPLFSIMYLFEFITYIINNII